MAQLSVFAPVKGPEGYSVLARDLIVNLHQQGVHVCLEEFKNWGPWSIALAPETKRILSLAAENKPYPSGDPISHLNICLPEQVRIHEDKRNFLYTMFESDNIPGSWIPFLKQMDEVIVPTEFNRWSFTHANEYPSDMITALPIGYDSKRYNPDVVPLDLHPANGTSIEAFENRFLIVCEVTNRKNFWGALRLWYRVASCLEGKDICVILKVGNYSRVTSVKSDIAKFQKDLVQKGEIADVPYNVFLYQPLLSEEVHPRFIKLGTHYLSTSFGEGWDLTALQAAACGLHVMVPYHSAYQCWLTQDVATLFPVSQRIPCQQEGSTARLYAGSNWSAIDLDAAGEMTLSALVEPKIVELKKQAMSSYIEQFSWDSLIPRYLKFLF